MQKIGKCFKAGINYNHLETKLNWFQNLAVLTFVEYIFIHLINMPFKMLFNFRDASTFFVIEVLDVRERQIYNCEM